MITPKAIIRDVWGLGVPNNGYPGAFPKGLIKRIKRKWWGKKRLWLFSGSFKDPDGVHVDINPDVKPDVVADCEYLPFKDEQFDFIMLDPPYSEQEAKRLYNLPYCNMLKVLNEAARVCKSGGYVILLHRLVPFNHPEDGPHFKRLIVKAIIGVYTISGWSNMRALTVWEKYNCLDRWVK